MKPRTKVALVFAVCAAPFVLGWLAYVFEWGGGKGANYGELLAPQVLGAEPFPQLKGRWVLVTLDPGACDAYCERKLYYLRQVRRAQGKEMDRMERLWVVTDAGKPRPELLAAIEGAHVSTDAALANAFPDTSGIYLVDPIGNLMMRFPADPDPSKMIKDLQRLLKYSGLG